MQELARPPLIDNRERGNQPLEADVTPHMVYNELLQTGATDLHIHFEGIFTPNDLETMWNRLGISLDNEVVMSMRKIMSESETQKNLAGFIGRLSTRWLRAGLIQGIMEGIPAENILKEYFRSAMDKMYDQGIVNAELMVALFNMTIEGDLGNLPVPYGAHGSAEQALIDEWNNFTKQHQKDLRSIAPTIRSYLTWLKEVVTDPENDRVVWGNDEDYSTRKKKRKPHGLPLRIMPVVQIRRDQKKDQVLMNSSTSQYPMVRKAGRPICEELINCYYGTDSFGNETGTGQLFAGFNMAGIEDKSGTGMEKFTGFFRTLKYNHVPCNVHAGEISLIREYRKNKSHHGIPSAVRQGMRNLVYVADQEGWIKRVGHGTLVVHMPVVLQRLMKYGVFLENCDYSNILTEVQPDNYNPLQETIRGDEERQMVYENYGIDFAQLQEQLIMQSGPYDDDPIIFKTSRSMSVEIAKHANRTRMLGFDTLKEYVTFLRDLGASHLMWNTVIPVEVIKERGLRPPRVFRYNMN